MDFLCIDDQMGISVRQGISTDDVSIPLEISDRDSELVFLDGNSTGLFGTLARAAWSHERREIERQRRELAIAQGYPPQSACHAPLPPVNPWLLAIVYCMWQYVQAGWSWETVQPLIKAVIDKLQDLGLIPAGDGDLRSNYTKLFWTMYLDNERLGKFYFGLQIEHESKRGGKSEDAADREAVA